MDQVARHSISGIAWAFVRVVGQSGIGLIVGVILARLLSVSDFGLMAIALVFIGLSELVSTLGVEASLIQRKEISDTHIGVAMTLATTMATLLFIIFYICANPLANFFHEPELANMLPVLGGAQWFATIAMVPRALLRRRFSFKLLSRIQLGSYILGYAIVSVILAYLDFGVWSLIIGTCVWFGLSCVLMFYHSKDPLNFAWRKQETRDLLSFGLILTAKYVLDYAGNYSSAFIIGRFMDAYNLGLYSRAQQVANLPLQKIAATLSSVMFPIYSSIQHDKLRLEQSYLQTVAATALLSLPPLAGATMASEWVIGGLYGEKWLSAAPIFALLCLASMFGNILHLAGALVEATNHANAEFRRQIVQFIFLTSGFLVAAQYSDLVHVAWVPLMVYIWFYVSMSQLALRILSSSWKKYLQAQLPGIMIAVLVAEVVYIATHIIESINPIPSRYIGLIIIMAVAGCVYLAALALISDEHVFGAKSFLREKIKKKRSAT